MEMAIQRFLELYYDEILESYQSDFSQIEHLEVNAAGAGASKFGWKKGARLELNLAQI